MDCQSCVGKIEHSPKSVAGVNDVRVSLNSQVMTATVTDRSADLPKLEWAITTLGYQLYRLIAGDAGMPSERQVPPRYRRALWIVVALNGIYGVAEIAAGYFARSHPIQADALDFLGDGLVTLMGALSPSAGALRGEPEQHWCKAYFLAF